MLLEPQPLPDHLRDWQDWEAEFVETTTVDASVVSNHPTGYVEYYPPAGTVLVCSGATLQQNKPAE